MTKSDLSVKQKRAVASLLVANTVEEAANLAGVHFNTLHRWMDDAAFVCALDAATDKLVDEHIRALASELRRNLEVMIGLRDNDDVPAPTRLRAASNLERHLQGWTSIHKLERRIAALESVGDDDGV